MARDTLYCPKCKHEVTYDVMVETETYVVKGEEVELDSYVVRCKHYGHKLHHPVFDIFNHKCAHCKYEKEQPDTINLKGV